MPLYEYQCKSCDHRFERIRKFSDPPLSVCPSCGGEVEKLISSPAIRFKGSGFYINDYAAKGETGEKSSEAKSSDNKDSPKKDSTDSTKKDSAKGESTTKTADAGKSKDSGSSGGSSAPTAAKSDSSKPS